MQNNQSFSSQTCSLEEDTLSGIIEKHKHHLSKKHMKPIRIYFANTLSFTSVYIEGVKRE